MERIVNQTGGKLKKFKLYYNDDIGTFWVIVIIFPNVSFVRTTFVPIFPGVLTILMSTVSPEGSTTVLFPNSGANILKKIRSHAHSRIYSPTNIEGERTAEKVRQDSSIYYVKYYIGASRARSIYTRLSIYRMIHGEIYLCS